MNMRDNYYCFFSIKLRHFMLDRSFQGYNGNKCKKQSKIIYFDFYSSDPLPML